MTIDVPEATWLDERQQITFAELLASDMEYDAGRKACLPS